MRSAQAIGIEKRVRIVFVFLVVLIVSTKLLAEESSTIDFLQGSQKIELVNTVKKEIVVRKKVNEYEIEVYEPRVKIDRDLSEDQENMSTLEGSLSTFFSALSRRTFQTNPEWAVSVLERMRGVTVNISPREFAEKQLSNLENISYKSNEREIELVRKLNLSDERIYLVEGIVHGVAGKSETRYWLLREKDSGWVFVKKGTQLTGSITNALKMGRDEVWLPGENSSKKTITHSPKRFARFPDFKRPN